MPLIPVTFFEQIVMQEIDNMASSIRLRSVNLGGATGPGGGTGGPPGGFIGQLQQSRVAGDTTESIISSGSVSSLVGNLNNLRAWSNASRQFFARETYPASTVLSVSSGSWYFEDGTLPMNYTGGNTPAYTLPVSNPRIDLLTVSTTGTLAWVQGAESATPTPPAQPSSSTGVMPLWNVYLTTSGSAIHSENKGENYVYRDARPFLTWGMAGGGSSQNPGDALYLRAYEDTTGPTLDVVYAGAERSAHGDGVPGNSIRDFTSGSGVIGTISSGSFTVRLKVQTITGAPVMATLYQVAGVSETLISSSISLEGYTTIVTGTGTIPTTVSFAPSDQLRLKVTQTTYDATIYFQGDTYASVYVQGAIGINGHVIYTDGAALSQRRNLSIDGAGVTVVDNAATGTTEVTITGASGSSVNDWFNVKAYGAVGDGVTDDTSAINTTLAAFPSYGGVIYFPAGNYLTSGSHVLSKPTSVRGDGGGAAYDATNCVSKISCNSQTNDLFAVTSHGCSFKEFGALNTYAGTPTSGAAIHVILGGDLAKYENVSVKGFYDNLQILDGAEWRMAGIHSDEAVRYSAYIRHDAFSGDFGDWSISDSWFLSREINGVSGIRIESGGGGKISNCKFNGGLADYGFTSASVDIAFAAGMASGIFLFSNNSIENSHGDGIRVANAAGELLHSIQITNNEFGFWLSNTGGHAISIAATALGLIPQVLIGSNTFRAGTPSGSLALGSAISLTNIDNISLGQYTSENWPSIYSLTGCTNIDRVLNFDPTTVSDGVYTNSSITLSDGVITAISNGSASGREVLMSPGVTPPDPILTPDGYDWIYVGV